MDETPQPFLEDTAKSMPGRGGDDTSQLASSGHGRGSGRRLDSAAPSRPKRVLVVDILRARTGDVKAPHPKPYTLNPEYPYYKTPLILNPTPYNIA